MSADPMIVVGSIASIGALSALGSLTLSKKAQALLIPKHEQTYLSDTLDFDRVDTDGTTLIGKTGDLIRTYEITGKDHNICHEEDLLKLIKSRQFLWDRLAEEGISLKVFTLREKVEQTFISQYDQPVLQEIHDRWMAGFKESYINRHYLVVEQKAKKQKRSKKTPDVITIETANKGKLEDISNLIQTILSEYGVKLLSHGSPTSSPLLSFWSRLINGHPQQVGSYNHHIAERITGTRVSFDDKTGIITYFDGQKTTYSAALSLNKWGEESSTTMMRELLSLEGEFLFLHLLKGHPKAHSLIKIEDKRKQQQLVFFSNKTQEELEGAKQLIEGDEATYWTYQFTIFLFADDLESLQTLIQQIKQVFTAYGIIAVQEMAAIQYVWRSQLPGEDFFLRPTNLMSHNLSYLMPFDRVTLGLPSSDWGSGPIRYMKTVDGGTYSLNLHVSEQQEALGHNVVIAPSGSGKTTLIQHLIAGALRHPDLRVFMFDRFNGTRIFTQACGGTYIDFKGQEKIQLNPFLMPDTAANQQTIRNLLTLMAGADHDLDEIDRILGLMGSLPAENRILRHCAAGLLNRHSKNYKSFKRWFTGAYADWFNGEQHNQAYDALDLKVNRLVGFEMTDILNNEDIVAPLTYYINARIKDAVYDQQNHKSYPHWLFYDETAPMLANAFLRDQMVKVDLQEARKRRGVVTLCFQSVQSLLDTGVSSVILDQCKTQFLFPNPNCKKETLQVYKNTFNLTDSETAFISGDHPQAKKKPYSVLLKKPNESIILDCDLSSLGNYIKLYKSGTEFVAQVSKLQQERGNQWLTDYLG